MILIIFINCIINQLFMYNCTGLYVPFPTIFANKRKDRLSDGIKPPPLPCSPPCCRTESSVFFKKTIMDIFRESRPFCATGRPTPTSSSTFHHRRRRYGKVLIGRAFLTMHHILDEKNQIHTDMALALPVVVKDAVAIWADMDALDRCSG